MDNKTKKILTSTIIASAVIGGASLSANTGSAFSFNELGSGSEIRTILATKSISDNAGIFSLEQTCGEGKKEANTESKSKDAKCGEGKCGGDDGKKETKSKEKKEVKKEEKKSESKSAEAKCGEGKCGK